MEVHRSGDFALGKSSDFNLDRFGSEHNRMCFTNFPTEEVIETFIDQNFGSGLIGRWSFAI